MLTIALIIVLAGVAPDEPSTAEQLGWPAGLSAETAPGVQEEDRKNEFAINVNLWPFFESTTLSTGERRTALWPLFHVSTNPGGDNHSWHVLNFLQGPDYHMFLPLYYVVDDNLGILPPVYLAGRDYWASVPLLSGSWGYDDGDRATWITPLFHVTTGNEGQIRNLHALAYFQGETSWCLPPLLSGGATYRDGTQVTWLTPLFHWTRDALGHGGTLHAGPYFEGPDWWALPPLLSWHLRYGDGTAATWATPLFHWTEDGDGSFRSMHIGPYLQARDYWMLNTLAGGGTYRDGTSVTWITPLFHFTSDAKGEVDNFHVGPYVGGRDWWGVPPLLTFGWSDGDGWRLTSSVLFWMHLDAEGIPDSSTLFPLFFWVRDRHWFFLPLVSGHWRDGDGGQTTLLTPLFHLTSDKEGRVTSWNALAYYQGEDYWAVPPLLSWNTTYADGTNVTWLTPFFHRTVDPKGDLASLHAGPYFQGDGYWALPPLFTWHTRYDDGTRTTWVTPLFHLTLDPNGELRSLHVGPYFQGDDYWAIPPLLSWHKRYEDGVGATWLTPLFHLTTDKDGSVTGTHLLPFLFYERDSFWLSPVLLSGGGTHADGSWTTWLTPLVHATGNQEQGMTQLNVFPAWYWKKDSYWAIPPLLSWDTTSRDGTETRWLTPLYHSTIDRDGTVKDFHVGPYLQGEDYWAIPPLLTWHQEHESGSASTWVTPLFHVTTEADESVSSLHLFPAFFYERDSWWLAPPLLSGGGRLEDGSTTTWVTPLFHETDDREGTLTSLHAAPFWFWERDRYWVCPPLLSAGGTHEDGAQTLWVTPLFHETEDRQGALESLHVLPFWFWKRDEYWAAPLLLSGGWSRPDGTTRTWVTPLYHDDHAADGSLRSRHVLTYFDGPTYRHVAPVYWDWTTKENVRHTLALPPLLVRTEEADGGVTTSLPWPLVSVRSGQALDTSLGMELRPFVWQTAGADHEFNFLWRLVSVLHEEESTRVMVGPLWKSDKPDGPGSMTKFQVLGGLFARDCNYETNRYRYRLLWAIPLGAQPMP